MKSVVGSSTCCLRFISHTVVTSGWGIIEYAMETLIHIWIEFGGKEEYYIDVVLVNNKRNIITFEFILVSSYHTAQ